MIELRRVIDAWEAAEREGRPVVLATVVRVAGSTYRRPGARLLCSEERWLAGGISGGCLEGDVLKKAFWRTSGGGPVVVPYDSRSDDEAAGWLGLGCNGLVEVLLERLDPGRAVHPLRVVAGWLARGEAGALATVVSATEGLARAGERLALGAGGDVRSDLPDGPLRDGLLSSAREALAAGRSRGASVEAPAGCAEVFVEVIPPPLRLLVFGEGHDVPPLVALARGLGWRVTVVSTRRGHATGAGGAAPDETVVVAPEAVAERVEVDRGTAAVVMTHALAHDQAILGALLASPAWYVGVLGPRRRTERLLEGLAASGARVDPARLGALHGPVGLDLGAEGPEEIALSIVAEIQAARAGRDGGPLRERRGPLHDAVPEPIRCPGAPL